jgi:hypothetical protein
MSGLDRASMLAKLYGLEEFDNKTMYVGSWEALAVDNGMVSEFEAVQEGHLNYKCMYGQLERDLQTSVSKLESEYNNARKQLEQARAKQQAAGTDFFAKMGARLGSSTTMALCSSVAPAPVVPKVAPVVAPAPVVVPKVEPAPVVVPKVEAKVARTPFDDAPSIARALLEQVPACPELPPHVDILEAAEEAIAKKKADEKARRRAKHAARRAAQKANGKQCAGIKKGGGQCTSYLACDSSEIYCGKHSAKVSKSKSKRASSETTSDVSSDESHDSARARKIAKMHRFPGGGVEIRLDDDSSSDTEDEVEFMG